LPEIYSSTQSVLTVCLMNGSLKKLSAHGKRWGFFTLYPLKHTNIYSPKGQILQEVILEGDEILPNKTASMQSKQRLSLLLTFFLDLKMLNYYRIISCFQRRLFRKFWHKTKVTEMRFSSWGKNELFMWEQLFFNIDF